MRSNLIIISAVLHLTITSTLLGQPSRRTRARLRRIAVEQLLADAVIKQAANGATVVTEDKFAALVSKWFELLDASQVGVVRQEAFLRRFGDIVDSSQASSRLGRFGPNRYLGFFVALDANDDAFLHRDEFAKQFSQWFNDWDRDQKGALRSEQLLAGFRSVLPRTNMGRGSLNIRQERPSHLAKPPPSPVVAADKAAGTIQLVQSFSLELTAAEPIIQDPIALSFDDAGRLHVLEFRSYMLDIEGSEERSPIGRISRLEDIDGDGRFDVSKVFLDELVLPRSVAATNGGILYVADYKLYFARDDDGDGKADLNQLIDPEYGGGNVEHAPNGLMTSIDNWIYNARSRYRYRWFGNLLVRQPTTMRGQWGITQDSYGRLFYNVNNSQLLGDYTPPNYANRNPHYASTAGMNLFVATNQRVFPIRMNTAVNRGYMPDVLDENGKLFVFASSCSPLVYRGDNFPSDFRGNVFVCDSAANLIKRNLVSDAHLSLSSRFAYANKEFLASTDERFRPVFLSNGPDGTLWVVDMYRGVNQYAMFMTPYLKKESLSRGLDKGIHFGRIYRVVADEREPAPLDRLKDKNTKDLVGFLSHPNGWIRDTAQRLLIEAGDLTVIPQLVSIVTSADRDKVQLELNRIHAMWTLEGLLLQPDSMGRISPVTNESTQPSLQILGLDDGFSAPLLEEHEEILDACFEAMADSSWRVQVTAIRVAESLVRGQPAFQAMLQSELEQLLEDASLEVHYQIALTAGNLPKPNVLPLLVRAFGKNPNEYLIREAIMTGVYRWEIPLLRELLKETRWRESSGGRTSMLQAIANAVMNERHPVNIDELLTIAASQQGTLAWRRDALLDGAAQQIGRSSRPIMMKSEPPAFAKLADSIRDETAGLARLTSIRARLTWPGNESDAATRPDARPLNAAEQKLADQGKLIFAKVCAGCHGIGGEGIRPLAAPLVDSEWVLGSEERLVRVLLGGLTGAVEVDGVVYQPPLVLPEMPSVRTLNDEQIAAVLTYIRREWGHSADPITPATITRIREQTQNRDGPWTEDELQPFVSSTRKTPGGN